MPVFDKPKKYPYPPITRLFLLTYYYAFRLIRFVIISVKVFVYGIVHPSVILNFLFGVVTEIAEFHKRCGGPLVNFKKSRLYAAMTQEVRFAKSNCLNAGFGTIRPVESQVLATLVAHLKPKTVFEFGTYTGFSTMHLSENAPADAVIYTLDLPYDKSGLALKNDMSEAHGDIKNINLNEKRHFHALDVKNKIVELHGDSMTFDFAPYYGKIDFVFIDANHSYAYVKSDTQNALRLLSEHGVIVWHDYDFIHPGVFGLINEVAKTKKIYYIERTRYALLLNDEQ